MAELISSNEIFFTSFEPKTKNRFIMYIDGIPSYIIKAVDSPKPETGTNVIDHININRKIKAGKTNWGDMTVTLYDPIVPSGAQAVMEWIRLSHESTTGRDGYADFYKKDVTINILGPVGDVISSYTLKGAFITSADLGSYDWASGDPQEISFVLSMDYVVFNF